MVPVGPSGGIRVVHAGVSVLLGASDASSASSFDLLDHLRDIIYAS